MLLRFLLLLVMICFTLNQNTTILTLKTIELLKTTNVLEYDRNELTLFIEQIRKVDTPQTPCSDLTYDLITCNFTNDCIFGHNTTVKCRITNPSISCTGETSFNKTYNCKYCWQLEPWKYNCLRSANCQSGLTRYKTFCAVERDYLCLGNREFRKTIKCEYTTGKIWLIAITLSVFLGGFGIDRCYMGHIGWGFLKGFSCGGFCLWTIVDVVLLYALAIGPGDGSFWFF